ncbi:pentapeptide repeat-containing protein [Aliiroseovarius crassostreae]|uniref:pentapeptide repeat-containing protein n=1 Tax=Aliiroseovarius crassostreae TaxID=154981 RepID=UPI0021F967F0|nr:pentapeptide repeat-containing protein [Aliiroseovarius crassostreae]UWP97606.1 pentapeptide repeat-containing protein [Aliiroseovarius crassostreae]
MLVQQGSAGRFAQATKKAGDRRRAMVFCGGTFNLGLFMQRQENKWLNWLGYTSYPKLENCKTCGAIVGVVLAVLALTLLIAFFITLAQFLHAIWDFGESNQEDVRNIGLILAAMIGFPFIVWRAVVAHKQVETAQQDMITDRINKAVENLGATRNIKKYEMVSTKGSELSPEGTYEVHELTEPNLEVRIGGILALERITRDDLSFHIQIMEILTAYVRENAPAPQTYFQIGLEDQPPPRKDIQTIITVLGRRSEAGKALEHREEFRLDLRAAKLTKANFQHGDFSAVDFSDSILEGADFSRSKLIGTRLHHCQLNQTHFWKASMIGTSMDFCEMTKTTGFRVFSKENNGPISIMGSDLTGIESPMHQFSDISTMGNDDTKLSIRGEKERTKIMDKRAEVEMAAFERDQDPDQAIQDFMETTPFRFWSPYSSRDGATWQLHYEFLKHHDLRRWPYIDPQ